MGIPCENINSRENLGVWSMKNLKGKGYSASEQLPQEIHWPPLTVCISCGNCSTYCEMGIDVRSYAQKGQDVVRSSCVGCGVCAAVCPRGVLRLENASEDISTRTSELRTIHITEDQVTLLS